MTQIYIKQNTHKHRTQNFRRISPFGITPVENAHKPVQDNRLKNMTYGMMTCEMNNLE